MASASKGSGQYCTEEAVTCWGGLTCCSHGHADDALALLHLGSERLYHTPPALVGSLNHISCETRIPPRLAWFIQILGQQSRSHEKRLDEIDIAVNLRFSNLSLPFFRRGAFLRLRLFCLLSRPPFELQRDLGLSRLSRFQHELDVELKRPPRVGVVANTREETSEMTQDRLGLECQGHGPPQGVDSLWSEGYVPIRERDA
jgi:hypothetical protein